MMIDPQSQWTVVNYCNLSLMLYAYCDVVQVEEISDEEQGQQPEAQFFKKQAEWQQDHCSHKEQRGAFSGRTCHRLQLQAHSLRTLIETEQEQDQQIGYSIIQKIVKIASAQGLPLEVYGCFLHHAISIHL